MQKRIFSWLLVIAVVFLSLGAGTVKAETPVSGSISNPVWTAANSPYNINGDLEVLAGATLTIEPGTVVKFSKGARLIVSGELKAIGTADKRIVFTSQESNPARGNWGGIQFSDSSTDAQFDANGNYLSGSILKYATVKYGNTIQITNASPFIDHNIILNNNFGITVNGISDQQTIFSPNTAKNIVSIVISNNEISDNGSGIVIDRTNKNDYQSTPAGMVRIGATLQTSILKANNVVNNNKGVVITQGDNNVLINNSINNNADAGVRIESTSENNILERNSISNNKDGVYVGGVKTRLYQNEINNNTNNGIFLEATNTSISYNNIANNKGANLFNKTISAQVEHNYWGGTSQLNIVNSDNDKKVVSDPAEVSVISLSAVLDPKLNEISENTVNDTQIISGLKPINAIVYINDAPISTKAYENEWTYSTSLNMSINSFKVYYKDENGNKSSEKSFFVNRKRLINIGTPVLEAYSKTTKQDTITITGSKDSNTSVWVNEQKVVDLSNTNDWSATLTLKVGVNRFDIKSKDSENYESPVVSVYITKEDATLQDIIDREKVLVKLDQNFGNKYKGYIILQVQNKGEAWYISTQDAKKYYLGREKDAYTIMRKLGLGIKHAELVKYLNGVFPDRLKGKILLDVEQKGEAYYVNPKDGKARYLSRPADAFKAMRELGIGMSNDNVRKITVGEIK
ncbi:MAG: right-handed parallel beta-helix repeat-containing protein [Planctomycetes bacterium]|jgi:parallel beta-helix repeat protein|nr:right-handed parallel beta-helix repeat-containing protein [Planctomycetota bacterium]